MLNFEIIEGVLVKYRGSKRNVTVPDGVKGIEMAAFEGCESLYRVVLPKGVTDIGTGAFFNCKNLCEAVLPEGLLKIGDRAFGGCGKLRVKIPESVKEIGFFALSECADWDFYLSRMDVNGFKIKDGILWGYCGRGGTIVVPQGVREIGDSAFANCERICEVIIPEGVSRIGCLAFLGCINLTEIHIPTTVKDIGSGAFSSCNALKKIIIPKGVDLIGMLTFRGCDALESVHLPDSVTRIRGHAFFHCHALSEITLPSEMSVIERGAFEECGISKITIPEKLVEVRDRAFEGCQELVAYAQRLNEDIIIYDETLKIALTRGFTEMLCDGTDLDFSVIKKHCEIIGEYDESRRLFRDSIVKKGCPLTLKVTDAVIMSGLFQNDAEVMTILISHRVKLGGGKSVLEDLEL